MKYYFGDSDVCSISCPLAGSEPSRDLFNPGTNKEMVEFYATIIINESVC